ncbi:hypothetical protein VTL71DRAFT_12852 [Oculimacula yallundae]|uniref:Uncharacterized protein n=1 Tax=Oculimacula yallundae TaxID=86028 RepID=A0ABR4CNN7_9HELO
MLTCTRSHSCTQSATGIRRYSSGHLVVHYCKAAVQDGLAQHQPRARGRVNQEKSKEVQKDKSHSRLAGWAWVSEGKARSLFRFERMALGAR